MDKKIKVQLDINISKRIHSLYDSFFDNPPKGVQYFKSEFKGINKNTYSKLGKLRKFLIKLFPSVEKLDKILINLIRDESDSDIIHFSFHLGKTSKNCVIDYEHTYNFIDIRNIENKENKEKARKILNKKNVKYLMPINYEALKSFKLFFGDDIKVHQEVVYPTINIPKENRKMVKKKKRIIFISTTNILTEDIFLIKGGLETLKAFKILAKRYSDYDFIILGKIPEYLKEKFPKNLILIDAVPRVEMWKLFNESQIFVQPCYNTPAMAFIEAMFFRLPIVTYNCWANKEYVDNLNGILINPLCINHIDKNNVPMFNREIFEHIKKNSNNNASALIVAIERLMGNHVLRGKMGKNGFQKVTSGKFSIKRKNTKLGKIYKQVFN